MPAVAPQGMVEAECRSQGIRVGIHMGGEHNAIGTRQGVSQRRRGPVGVAIG